MKARLKIKLLKDFIHCGVLWCTAMLFWALYNERGYGRMDIGSIWIVFGVFAMLLFVALYRLRLKEEDDFHRRRLKRLNYPEEEPWEN